MRLTASCEIMVKNVGRAGGYVALEITQGKAAGEEVTTLLLCPDRARELASVLLRHSDGVREEVPGAETQRGPEEGARTLHGRARGGIKISEQGRASLVHIP